MNNNICEKNYIIGKRFKMNVCIIYVFLSNSFTLFLYYCYNMYKFLTNQVFFLPLLVKEHLGL